MELPTLSNLSINPISFDFKTKKGINYEIQVSGDFKKWDKFKEIDGAGGVVEIIDGRKAYYQQQYYRLKVVQ